MRSLYLLASLLLTTASLAAQERTQSPHGKLSLECAACHRSDGWTPVQISKKFDHSKFGFPLVGAHTSTNCRACHQGLDFKGTSTTCASCHQDTHRGELGVDCARCHTPRSFLDRSAMARAHQSSRFPLEGPHLATDCANCHRPTGQGQLRFVGLNTDCVSCHRADYVAAKEPDHQAGGLPTDCIACHTVSVWTRGRFDHNAVGFPLTGAHKATSCVQCHVAGRYRGTPQNCAACHQADYDHTTSPNHSGAGFGTDCVSCHGTASWSGAAFDHNTSAFPLTGSHKATPCSSCHLNNRYAGTPTTCVACHQQDYNTSTNPNHVQSQFPTDCTQCHSTIAWVPSSFSHGATAFPLTGVHTTTPCSSCHINSVYKGTATQCESCHLRDYTSATSPNHVQYGWPQTCISCHSGSSNTTAWDSGVTLPNQYHTMFPLTHQRARGVCTECHNTTVYSASTCSNHHHPASCTFLNQRSCD